MTQVSAYSPGSWVFWVLEDGQQFIGQVLTECIPSVTFPGECLYDVRMGTDIFGENRLLEGRDLIPTIDPFYEVPVEPTQPAPEPVPAPVPLPLPDEGGPVVVNDGVDTRDLPGGEPVTLPGGVATAASAGLIAMAMRILLGFMGRATTIAGIHWNRLPGWARLALSSVGIGVGTVLVAGALEDGSNGERPSIPGGPLVSTDPMHDPHMIDGHLGAHIIGSWVANGVTFYRLSDGRLAVQNKRGKWKIWRPKKPIVLMPTGAGDLRTLLRADAVLNRQSKKIAAMLNRRAPRKARAPKAEGKAIIVAQDRSRVVDI